MSTPAADTDCPLPCTPPPAPDPTPDPEAARSRDFLRSLLVPLDAATREGVVGALAIEIAAARIEVERFLANTGSCDAFEAGKLCGRLDGLTAALLSVEHTFEIVRTSIERGDW